MTSTRPCELFIGVHVYDLAELEDHILVAQWIIMGL